MEGYEQKWMGAHFNYLIYGLINVTVIWSRKAVQHRIF